MFFKSVIEKTDYSKLADVSKRRPLKSGIVLSGNRPESRIPISGGEGGERMKGPFAFDDYGKWRIVAMRFDPCASTLTHNRRINRDTPLPDKFTPQECTSSVRLTAQPIIRREDDTFVFREFQLDANGNEILNPDGTIKAKIVVPPIARPKAPQAGDFAMHLVYPLTPTQAIEFAQGLLEFKATCKGIGDGLPLTVSPCRARSTTACFKC